MVGKVIRANLAPMVNRVRPVHPVPGVSPDLMERMACQASPVLTAEKAQQVLKDPTVI